MTLGDLIKQLQELEDGYGCDTEVLIVTKPSWPLQFHVDHVALVDNDDDRIPTRVYVVTGSHPRDSAYAPEGV